MIQVEIFLSDTEKKIEHRSIELQDKKVRQLCLDYQYESIYLWNTDPDRQFSEIYDSKINDPNN
jgi:hypothetical protein